MVCGVATPLGSGTRCCFVYIIQMVLSVFAALYFARSVRALSAFSALHALSVGELIDIRRCKEVEVSVTAAKFYLRSAAIYPNFPHSRWMLFVRMDSPLLLFCRLRYMASFSNYIPSASVSHL